MLPYLPLSGTSTTAKRIAEYVNTLIANNPAPIQQYIFANIALSCDVTVDEVRRFIGGGNNGFTIRVDEETRRRMAGYKRT